MGAPVGGWNTSERFDARLRRRVADERGRAIDDAKAALRGTTLAARRSMSDDARAHASLAVGRHLLALPELRRARTVALYAALPDEVDLTSTWRELVATDADVVFPRVSGPDLEFARAHDAADLVPGTFGIHEPTAPTVDPDLIDVLVLPGAAFDHQGGRLGMGGGWYDRFLATSGIEAVRVGVAFGCQVTVRVPMAEHDEPIDVLVTEHGVHRMAPPPPTTA